MKMIKLNLFLLALLLSVPTLSVAGWFGPSNYDECILESMKGVKSDLAASVIVRSCRDKFPDKPRTTPRSRELSSSELGQITGRAKPFENYFLGNLHNGNSGVTISQITVVVTTKADKKDISRTYVADVNIPPQTAADFGFRFVEGDGWSNYSWRIEGARGY